MSEFTQPFEKHEKLRESILHAANFWSTDTEWSNHLEQINKVCQQHSEFLAVLKNIIDNSPNFEFHKNEKLENALIIAEALIKQSN